MTEIQQGCRDYTQDVEEQGQNKDNRIDNVVKDRQGVGQVVHGAADRLMTACNAELTATTRNDGGELAVERACKGTGKLQGWGGESSVVGLRTVSGAEKLHFNLPYC